MSIDTGIGLFIGLLYGAFCIACVRIGFKMGRMTQDKPVETPKTFNPGGESVLQEYDAYEDALNRPKGKSTVEDNA